MNNKQNLSGNKSKRLTRWIDTFELMNRWHVNELELVELVVKFDLPIYDEETLDWPDDDSIEWTSHLVRDDLCVFKLDEVEHFESKHEDFLPKAEEPYLKYYPQKCSATAVSVLHPTAEEPYLKELSPKEARKAPETKKKLRPNQEAKIKCREIAKEKWKKHPKSSIKEMASRPEIIEHGGNWTHRTRHKWICDLAPEEMREPGVKKRS